MEFPVWWSSEDQVTVSAYPDLTHPFRLPSGLPALDQTLQGGFPTGRLIELHGESGCGKTNFAISLIAQAAGKYTSSWYISTFKPISRSRLDQIGINPAFLTIRHCSSLAEVDQTLFSDLYQALIHGDPIRLVVIDPVSGLVNEAFSEDNPGDGPAGFNRSQYLTRQAVVLRHLSQKYGFVCLLLNTIAADTQGGVRPSLGLTWSNLVNDRFRIVKDHSGRRLQQVFGGNAQTETTFAFVITNDGLRQE